MNLVCEPLETSGKNYFLVGDLYHWELNQDGYFVIERNSDDSPEDAAENYFENFNIESITENIQN